MLLGAAYLASIFPGWDLRVSFVVYGVLICMYIYITVVLFYCDSSRPHRGIRFVERAYAVINVLFLPGLLLFDTFYREIPWVQSVVTQRIYTFPVYYLVFCILSGIESVIILKAAPETRESPASSDPLRRIPADVIETYGLTTRETEIVELLLAGHSYSEVGAKLFISLSTVKTHIQRIYRKTDVSNKIQLINRLRG